MQPLRELKARKAKYGFEANVCIETIALVGDAISFIRLYDPEKWIIDQKFNGYNYKITMYTNDDVLARCFRERYAQEIETK